MIQEAEVRGYEEVEGEDKSTEEERSRVKIERLQEVQDNNTLRREVSVSPSRKRGGEESTACTKKSKIKFPLLSENWERKS